MGQDLNKIKKAYDIVANEYTETFSNEHAKKTLDQEILNKFSLKVANKKPVWDLGCGPGQTTKYLHRLGISISGLDLSEKILEQARINHPELHFQQGNILKLDFNSSSIPGIVAFYSIVHFTKEQVNKALHEFFRVLQPEGVLLFTYHIGNEIINVKEFLGKKVNIDFMLFTTDFILDCLKECGFDKIEIIEREPYPEVEYQSRRAYVFAIKPVI